MHLSGSIHGRGAVDLNKPDLEIGINYKVVTVIELANKLLSMDLSKKDDYPKSSKEFFRA